MCKAIIRKALFLYICMALILPLTACSNVVDTDHIPTYDKTLSSYSDEEILILETISELAAHKAASTLTDDMADSIFSSLFANGAMPNENELEKLAFDSTVKAGDDELDNMADFVRCFEGTYDVFAIKKDATVCEETYSVYEIIIQDASAGGYLSTELKQGENSGWELYSDKELKTVACREKEPSFFESVTNSLSSMFGRNTSSGLTESYRVSPVAVSTVSFLFVEDSGGEWHHCLSSNYVTMHERHSWSFSAVTDGKKENNSGDRDETSTVYPEHYESRAYLAALAYTNGDFYDITKKDVSVSVDMSEFGGKDKQATLSVVAPLTAKDIIELSEK